MTQTAHELSDQITKAPSHEDRIQKLDKVFYVRWTSGPDYERAFLCIEDGEADMRDFAIVSFGQAELFVAAFEASRQVTLSALADAELQLSADSRIAELEQQIANIKASRDCQVTIAAGEEERARKAEAERDELKQLIRENGTPRFNAVCARAEAAEALLQQMTEYALEVTRALTGLSGGGSEMFSGRVGNIYKADSEKCCGVVHDRHAKMHGLLVNAVKSKNAAEVKLAEAVKVMEQPFCVLFLDGRNEHGSHVLPSYPRAFEPVGDDIDDQTEAILLEAERLGFTIGEHVWAEFFDVPDQIGDEGRIEFSGYWEFKGINVEMSRVINASTPSKLEASYNAKA
jgi:hypothetical protein